MPLKTEAMKKIKIFLGIKMKVKWSGDKPKHLEFVFKSPLSVRFGLCTFESYRIFQGRI